MNFETYEVLAALEELLRNEKIAEVDAALDRMKVERFQPASLIAAVTITQYAKEQLTRREDFLARVEESLNYRLGVERTARLLANRR